MPEMSWEYAVDKIYIITFCDYWNDKRTAVALAVSSSENKGFGSTFYNLDDKFTGAFPFAPMMFEYFYTKSEVRRIKLKKLQDAT